MFKKSKEFKYRIIIHGSLVIAKIYYEIISYPFLGGQQTIEIQSCYKEFGGSWWRTRPLEKHLKSARDWAKRQCELMNNTKE